MHTHELGNAQPLLGLKIIMKIEYSSVHITKVKSLEFDRMIILFLHIIYYSKIIPVCYYLYQSLNTH